MSSNANSPLPTYSVDPNGNGFSILRHVPGHEDELADDYTYDSKEYAELTIQGYQSLDERLREPSLDVYGSTVGARELVCVLAMGGPAETLKLYHDQKRWTGGVLEYQRSAFTDKVKVPISAEQAASFYAKGVLTADGRRLAAAHPVGWNRSRAVASDTTAAEGEESAQKV